jgi:hypothetical protein
MVTTAEVLPKHTHPDVQFAHQGAKARASEAGVSLRTQRKLDALARKAPELLAAVQAGHVAATAATTGEVLPSDGSVNQYMNEGAQIGYPNSRSERARKTGVSRETQRKLDALAHKAPGRTSAARSARDALARGFDALMLGCRLRSLDGNLGGSRDSAIALPSTFNAVCGSAGDDKLHHAAISFYLGSFGLHFASDCCKKKAV